MDLTICCLFTRGSYIGLTYILSRSSLHLPIAGVFSRRTSASVCITVLPSSVVVMETGQKAVPRQERLCPEPAHAVLTAGEQNVAHGTSGWRDVGKINFRLKSAGSSKVMVFLFFTSCAESTTQKQLNKYRVEVKFKLCQQEQQANQPKMVQKIGIYKQSRLPKEDREIPHCDTSRTNTVW